MRKIIFMLLTCVLMLLPAYAGTPSDLDPHPHVHGTPGAINPHVEGTPGDIDPHTSDTPGPGDLDPHPKIGCLDCNIADGPTPFTHVVPWARAAFDEASERIARQTFVTRRKGKLVFHDCWDVSAIADSDQLAFVDAVRTQNLSRAIYTQLEPLRQAFAANHRKPHTDRWLTNAWHAELALNAAPAIEPIALPLISIVLKMSMPEAETLPAVACTTGRCDCAVCTSTCDCQQGVFRGSVMIDCKPPRSSCNVTIYDTHAVE